MTARLNLRPSPRWLTTLGQSLQALLPPVIALLLFLALWQLFTMAPGATLPTPIRTVTETWELIVNPFFDYGGTDKGLFWQ
ncbi:MAG: nitrate ABC transporter, permease protein, partial [Nodosilinea sp.]